MSAFHVKSALLKAADRLDPPSPVVTVTSSPGMQVSTGTMTANSVASPDLKIPPAVKADVEAGVEAFVKLLIATVLRDVAEEL